MPVVTFLPGYRKARVPQGATVLEAAQKAGLVMNVVCGGQGKCGKCIVRVESGDTTFDREKFGVLFAAAELDRGSCLACQTRVFSDARIEVPARTLVQEQKILVDARPLDVPVHPSVRKYALALSPPTLDDPSSDLARLLDGVERAGGPAAAKVYAPLDVLRKIPVVLRHGRWRCTATVALVPGGYRLINVEEGDTAARLYGAAVDLGTTTVVAYLWDLAGGRVLSTASNYNRQISCGEDILSRVNYAKKNGTGHLQELAAASINTALTAAADAAGIDLEDIYEVMVAGNTVMTHLLLDIDPAYMIAEPYVPVVRRTFSTTGQRLGLAVAPTAGVFTFPAVSNFIGGDIVADILTSGMADQDEISLLIDIGTNFEVVLGGRDWMLACAGAAGPALEGGEVLFGMRANPGAIERVRIDEASLEPAFETINDVPPVGICGSGLIDLLAGLIRACVIDRTGQINTGIDHPRIRMGRHFPEYVVAWEKESGAGKDIVITGHDIRNLILSKAAVLAACITLMDAAGIAHDDLATVFFSGAFGTYIDKENAVTIGLIPEVPLKRVRNLGNGAVTGANQALVSRERRNALDRIARTITYIELNADPGFMDRYTQSCFLPHTDLSLFPTVQRVLEECRLRRGAQWQG
jgi:uncharacterized 2Fe-2S/4Fe-4S cluster protein (DUF4445 family)